MLKPNPDPLNHPAIAIFKKLLDKPSPSGREQGVAKVARSHLNDMGYASETDPAGNVLVRLKGRKPHMPPMVLAAHMDEIGMVVTAMDENGNLNVGPSGGLYPWKIGERPVEVIGNKRTVRGVFSMGSTHRPQAGEKPVQWADTRIITGFSKKRLESLGIRVGSCAVPTREDRGPVFLGEGNDPLVAAWTFDDRMGVVALLRMLGELKKKKVQPIRPILVCFTVQEEGGGHGAKVLAHREKPEVFVAVDGCPIPPGADLKLDGRPGVWSKDEKVHFDQALVTGLCAAAQRAGTGLQVAAYERAYSDASAVYDTGGAPRVATVGHVRENSHGYEVARLSCFDNLLKTLLEFVRTFE